MTLCAGLDALFGELPVTDALTLVDEAGLRLFEFWDWRGRDLDTLRRTSHRLGLRPLVFSANTFDEPFVDPTGHERTLRHLEASLSVAERLQVTLLVAHVGYRMAGASERAQWEACVRGLRMAGELAQASGVVLAIEPLNSTVDHPGYFLDSLTGARRLVEEVGHGAVGLLLDLYHVWLMHGEGVLGLIPGVARMTRHVHVADVPGRGEPGSGEIPWDRVLDALEAGGYRGEIGLECWPTASPQAALARARSVLGGRAEGEPS